MWHVGVECYFFLCLGDQSSGAQEENSHSRYSLPLAILPFSVHGEGSVKFSRLNWTKHLAW